MKKLTSIIAVIMLIVSLGACSAEKAGEEKTDVKETAKRVKVKLKTMAYQTFEHYFKAHGTVEAVNEAYISPEINGRIKQVHVKEGDQVQKGQLMVSLNSEIIESGIAELESGLELAQTVYKKRKGLWEKKIGSEIQYLQAKTDKLSLENKLKSLKAQLRMAKIKAPISGIVDKIVNKEGELAIPGMQLIQLVNLKKIYVNAEVSEAYLPKVHKGDSVHATFPTFPELDTVTTVHRTGNIIKTENRTFLVQLLLDNPEGKLKPNILSVIKMKDFYSESALVVPSIIIKNDLTGSYLYVVEKGEGGKSVAKKIYITPGMSEGSSTMVTKGLKAGQKVILDGYNLVKNGIAVEIVKGS